MNKILITTLTTALCTSLAAQTTFTAPNGHDTKSGNYIAYNYAHSFLAGSVYTNVRLQMTDDSMPAGKATLSQMEYRTQNVFSQSTGSGMGRTLTGVQLHLAHATKSIVQTFTANYNGSRTTVFSAKTLTLPSYTSGKPSPQTWGNVAKFPFSTNFMWDSSKGRMLQEWEHASSMLANGFTSGSAYYLDGNRGTGTSYASVGPSTSSTAASRYVPSSPFTAPYCNDGGNTATNARSAYSYMSAGVYADGFYEATLAGKGRIFGYSYYTASGAPAISMMSVGGSDAGINAGAMCNKVHVNTLFPLAIIAKKTGTSTNRFTSWSGAGGLPSQAIPYNTIWAGTVLYWQTAWDDSKSKLFSLTTASKIVVPKKGTYKPSAVSTIYYRYNRGASRYHNSPFTSEAYNPIERWTKK